MPFFKKQWPFLGLLLFLVLITYGNSLNNAFLSDDLAEIVQNPNISDLSSAISTHPFGFIRPVIYWLAFQIGGLNPFLFRITNVLFHLGSSVLIFAILSKIHQSKKIALFAASLFAVHPAISEAVVWVSGGMYSQYTFFFLLSLLFYIFSASKRFYYFLSCLFYLLSLMSHPQTPILLFLIFPLYEFVFGKLGKNWPKAIPFLLISVFYVFVNLGSLSERTSTLQTTHYQEKGIDNPFVQIPIAISTYFELLIFPKVLTLYHSELNFEPIQFLIRAMLTLAFLGILGYVLARKRIYFFWLSLFWISLAPTLTPFRLNWIVAERYLYLPSIAIFVILAIILNKFANIRKYKNIIYIVFGIVIISLSTRTIIRNIDWKNEDNLWIATGKTSPSSPNTHNNLGDVYGRWGDKQKAMKEFQTAIALKPNYGDAYHNLANTYREVGEKEKALENYQKAVGFNPNLWQSYQNIAALYFEDKQFEKAVEYIQKAITINPKNINLYNNLGVIYLAEGDKQKAKEIFIMVLNADPQNQFARQGLFETSK